MRGSVSSARLLSLTLSHPIVLVQILEDSVKLVGPADKELAGLRDKAMRPGQLLLELARCGLCVTPIDEDAQFVKFEDGSPVTPKVRSVATPARQQAD